LVNGFWTLHGRRETIALVDGLNYILITPIPVGPFPVGHHFPAHYAEAPDVGRRGEFPKRYCLWGCPSHRDFTTLEKEREREQKMFISIIYIGMSLKSITSLETEFS
jgi:hypothetical protein